MRIIAPTKIKVKLALFVALFSILSGLIIGLRAVEKLNAVDASVQNNAVKTVIIDAGHGGADGGTSSVDGVLEKDMTMRGELYRELLPLLTGGSAEERATASAALKMGLAALEGRNITD